MNTDIPRILNGDHRNGKTAGNAKKGSQKIQDCLLQAETLFQRGNLDGACESLQQGLRQFPNDVSLLECLGNIQFVMGKHEAALASFTSASEAVPDNVDVLVKRGISAAHCDQADVFEKTMEQVFELDPENPAAHRFLGKLQFHNHHFTEAVEHYAQVVRREPNDVQSLLNAGDCYFKLSNLPAARKMFEQALKTDANNATVLQKLKQLQIVERISTDADAFTFKPVPPPAPAAPAAKPAGNLESLIADIRADRIPRAHFAHGLLLATLQAMRIGLKQIAVFEFGVLHGDGLLNLCSICQRITDDTGFQFKIFGFDSDVGMPPITDYRDHPEIWYTGQFKVDHAKLISRLPANAKLIVGDIAKTIKPFCQENLSPECPVGFVTIDVDLYSSSMSAFKLFKGKADCYLPAVVMYFDDVNDMITLNSWCGEALAIKHFNRANKYRKIEEKWTRQNVTNAGWHDQVYICHVLDHPVRSGKLKCASLDLNVTIY